MYTFLVLVGWFLVTGGCIQIYEHLDKISSEYAAIIQICGFYIWAIIGCGAMFILATIN